MVDNKQIAGNGTTIVVGHSAGYVYFGYNEPIFEVGTYKRISLDFKPYINGVDNPNFFSINITPDSADPHQIQINTQSNYKNTQTESESTVSDKSQDTPEVDSAFDSTILGYISLLQKTKEEIGLSDEQKVDQNVYYLGTGMFLNEERRVYIYIDDEEPNMALNITIGDPGDFPSMDEMKEQLNKIYGEPEYESELRCRYYDKENYLKISIVKRILPTEEYTEVIVSPYKYNRNK